MNSQRIVCTTAVCDGSGLQLLLYEARRKRSDVQTLVLRSRGGVSCDVRRFEGAICDVGRLSMDTQRTAIGVVPDRTEPEPCQRAAVHAERLCSPMLNQIIQLVMQAASRIPTKAITASAQSIVCLRSVSGLRQLGGRPAGQADPASRAAQRAVSTPRSIQVWSCAFRTFELVRVGQQSSLGVSLCGGYPCLQYAGP